MSAQFTRRCLLFVLGLVALAAPLAVTPYAAQAQAEPGMPSFRSDAELLRFLKGSGRSNRPNDGAIIAPPPPPPPPPAPVPMVAVPQVAPSVPTTAPPSSAPSSEVDSVTVTGSRVVRQDFEAISPVTTVGSEQLELTASEPNDAITSNQVQGVDEGGIVKVIGGHLVILRRGKLFTVSTAGGGLKPADSINAFPPGVSGRGDWYDEMLVRGDLIVVVGYSYARGGAEVNRFRMAPNGKLSFQDAYHLRSNDYYSSENYASRIVGDQLVVYSPLYLGRGMPLEDMLPGVSRWERDQKEPTFRRLATARDVYIPTPLLRRRANTVDTMHAVTRCNVTAVVLDCRATAVLGPESRIFFVSQNAIYLWVNPSLDGRKDETFLYRIPLNGGRPAAVQVRGAPVNQFSFNANTRDGVIEVLTTPEGDGDAMWAPEFASGRPALLRLPTFRFGDGSRAAPRSDYRFLPGGKDVNISANRYVGDYLLYGLDAYGGRSATHPYRLVVAATRGGAPSVFDMDYSVERIEAVGPDALAVGSYQSTVFQAVDLEPGARPKLGDRFEQPDSRQAETRSHAFFYDPTSPDGRSGVAGLPVLRLAGSEWITDMLFLRRAERKLGEFGVFSASPNKGPRLDDGCEASCVDWYGNARPIFLRGRVFALLGYELVEGDASGARIREVRRVDFAPPARR